MITIVSNSRKLLTIIYDLRLVLGEMLYLNKKLLSMFNLVFVYKILTHIYTRHIRRTIHELKPQNIFIAFCYVNKGDNNYKTITTDL